MILSPAPQSCRRRRGGRQQRAGGAALAGLLPVDMMDDPRFRGDWLRFPRFAAQSREMLAFAHIPTGTHTPGIFIMDLKKKKVASATLPFRRGTG